MPHPLLALPFLPAHAQSLRLRPGPAWAVLCGDRVIACGGAVRFWPGVGECWCWAGQDVDLVPLAFARLARRVVESLAREHGFHRLQLHAREDDSRANRFAAHLGFILEGRCPGFGPAQTGQATYNLYGRFRTWKE